MQPIDNRRKNLFLRLAEIIKANKKEEASLALWVKNFKQSQAAKKPVKAKNPIEDRAQYE